jgi:hypothetical protein
MRANVGGQLVDRPAACDDINDERALHAAE